MAWASLYGPLDGISALGCAFYEAKEDGNRRAIAAAFRRGFEPLGIQAENDDVFVQRCVAWYRERKGAIDIAPYYGMELLYGDAPGLFIVKKDEGTEGIRP